MKPVTQHHSVDNNGLMDDDGWSPAHNPEAIAVSEGQWILWALDLHAFRVRTGRDPHRQIDARVFVFMLRQLLHAAEMQQEAISSEVGPEICAAFRRACTAFEQEVPGLIAARDILTHFNEYAVGDGRLQRKLRKETGIGAAEAARRFWGGGYDPSTGEFVIGPHRIHIERAKEAAHGLVHAIYAAGKEVDFARERKAEAQAGIPGRPRHRRPTGEVIEAGVVAVVNPPPIQLT